MEDLQYVPPKEQDLLLSDVREQDLKQSIAHELGIPFMSESSGEALLPIEGILFGHNFRPFVCLHVRRKSISRNVFFLVDTGSPHTYLSRTTVEALGISDSIPEGFIATIHGENMYVNLSPANSHYTDINIIGSDFLSRKKIFLEVDYVNLVVRMRAL